jgi:hypothetical protein
MDFELHEALARIAEIRHQMARTEVFRGYRALPVAISGGLAAVSALVQAAWITQPISHFGLYLFLWVSAAVLSAAVAAAGMLDRRRRAASAWNREVTILAVELFLPSIIAGGLLTAAIVVNAPEVTWMLPGLWQVLFSLGIFASSRLLPGQVRVVAAWYLTTGIACLAVARGEAALSPWAMGLPFAIGQLLAALVLHFTLERDPGGTR